MASKRNFPLSSRIVFSLFIALIVVSLVRLVSDFTNDCICHIPIPQDYNEYLIFKRNCQCEYVPFSVVLGQYLLYVVLPFLATFSVLSFRGYISDDK